MLDGASQPPGTKLGNGFTVAPGSFLIGDVFPFGTAVVQDGERIEDRGWQAHLLVVGEPSEVIAHYQREGRAAGLAIGGGRFREAHFCGEDPVDGYACFAHGEMAQRARMQRFTVRFARRAARPGRGDRDVPQSFAHISFSDSNWVGGGQTTRPATAGPPAPPLPTGWTAPARPGERVGVGLPDGAFFELEPGSRAAAPPIFSLDRAVPVPQLVLRIDDDPERVLEAYRQQFDELLERRWRRQVEQRPIERRRDDGASVLHMSIGGDGDLTFDLTALVREGKPTWAFLVIGLGS